MIELAVVGIVAYLLLKRRASGSESSPFSSYQEAWTRAGLERGRVFYYRDNGLINSVERE